MKGSKMKTAAALFAASVVLSGCGDALYEMAPEEQAAIVSYAAHTVAKFNNFQKDGEVFVKKDVLENGGADQEKKTPAGSGESTPAEDVQIPQESAVAQDDGALQGENLSQGAASGADAAATMNQALDLGVVQADFMGSSLCTTYEKSASYAIDAPAGSQLLVLKVKLANPSDQDLSVDILAMTPVFQVTVNGEYTAPAQTTILPNDLSTYQGDLLAGESKDTVLLFAIPQDIQSVSGLSLKITMNGSQNTVNL